MTNYLSSLQNCCVWGSEINSPSNCDQKGAEKWKVTPLCCRRRHRLPHSTAAHSQHTHTVVYLLNWKSVTLKGAYKYYDFKRIQKLIGFKSVVHTAALDISLLTAHFTIGRQRSVHILQASHLKFMAFVITSAHFSFLLINKNKNPAAGIYSHPAAAASFSCCSLTAASTRTRLLLKNPFFLPARNNLRAEIISKRRDASANQKLEQNWHVTENGSATATTVRRKGEVELLLKMPSDTSHPQCSGHVRLHT